MGKTVKSKSDKCYRFLCLNLLFKKTLKIFSIKACFLFAAMVKIKIKD
jgi:hypothetical protein